MPTGMEKLADFATRNLSGIDGVQAEISDSRSGLQSAMQGVRDAEEQYQDALHDLATINEDIDSIRTRLARAQMPADMDSLVVELRAAILEARAHRQEMLEAERNRELAQFHLQQARERLETGEQALSKAVELDRKVNKWKAEHDARGDALGTEPLSQLQSMAGDALGSDDFNAAKERIEGMESDGSDAEIRPSLRERAIARGEQVRNRLELWEAASANADAYAKAAQTGVPNYVDLDALWRDLEAAIGRFAAYVARGPQRLDSALQMLRQIVDAEPLTPAQRERTNETGLVTDGESAIALEATWQDAQQDLEETRAELFEKNLQKAWLELERGRVQMASELLDDGAAAAARVAQLDTLISSLETGIGALDGEVATLTANIGAARAAFLGTPAENLDRWEAAFPDGVWDRAIWFYEAQSELETLRDLDPATLRNAVDEAADRLEKGLRYEAVRQRITMEQISLIAEKREEASVDRALLRRAVREAVRGDERQEA